jgi:hypothetical protein
VARKPTAPKVAVIRNIRSIVFMGKSSITQTRYDRGILDPATAISNVVWGKLVVRDFCDTFLKV